MRTLLTYVLAALAAALVPALWSSLGGMIDGWSLGDPTLAAGAISESIVRLVLWTGFLLLSAAPLWMAVRRWLPAFPEGGLARYLLHGGVMGWLIIAAIGAALFLTDWFAMERTEAPPLRVEIAAVLGFWSMPGIFFIAGGAIIGALWGAVFWIRAPREPKQAGIPA